MTKLCPLCGEAKPHEDFSPSKRHRDGRAYFCRPCAAAKRRDYYARTVSSATRAEAARKQRIYLSDPANAQRDRENSRTWAKVNADRVNERNRAWRARNPEKARSISRRSKAKNPEADRMHVERRRALKLAAPINDFTAADWRAVLEEFAHRCGYCLRGDVPLQQDHMTALSRGGNHTRSNIVPACAPCNRKKGTKTMLAFLRVGS